MRIDKKWKDRAYEVVHPICGNEKGHQFPSDRALILAVAKALKSEFERGNNTPAYPKVGN